MIYMKFTNFSDAEWDGKWGMGHNDVDSLVTTPSDKLKKGSGVETLEIDPSAIAWLADGGYNCWCYWSDQSSMFRFGIQIIIPEQAVSIGPRPYWEVMYDWGGKMDFRWDRWKSSGEDPANPYEWEKCSQYLIRATPKSGHSSLEIDVSISNKHKRVGKED